METDERIALSPLEAGASLNRRQFVQRLSTVAASGTFMSAAFAGCTLTRSQRAEANEAVADALGKLPRRQLGRKMGKMEVSRVVWCTDNSGELLEPCLAAGMNFVHKAGYWNSVPEAVKKLPRDSYYTDITVDNTSPGQDPNNYEQAYGQVVTALAKTGLKYFDIYRAHFGWHTLDSFNKGDNTSYKAFLKLKKEGKVKYFGVSQHAAPRENYETYATMIQAQIDSGLIDTMQVWLSYASTPDELAIFEKAHKAGIGITAMKTRAHGYGNMRRDAAMLAKLKSPELVTRACLRYVLGLPYVDCCVSSLHSFDEMQENLGAVTDKVAMRDGFVIEA